ncbi:MAG: hypothetical protein SV583_02115 [Pseudomonadota bacterium]|nr:hypothetical protein [Pseudomonadota bacterium]
MADPTPIVPPGARWVCRLATTLVWLLSASLPPSATAQTPLTNWRYLEFAYTSANPDYSRFDDGEGHTLQAAVPVGDHFFVQARHTDAPFTASGNEIGRSRPVERWQGLGGGVRTRSDSTEYHVVVQRQRVEFAQRWHYGTEWLVGLTQPWRQLQVRVEFGALDLVSHDLRMGGELTWWVHPAHGISARIRDYGRWDFTHYEFGWRFIY